MKISVISDLHAHKDGAEENSGHQKLRAFIQNPRVNNSDVVVFLGDVFDLLVGDFEQYENEYSLFFNFLKGFSGTVFFMEGNHDFLCAKLFKKFKNVSYFSSHAIIDDCGKKIFLSHGDGPELSLYDYKLTKAVLNNPFTGHFIQAFVDYHLINKIGNFLSRSSRNKNMQKYTHPSTNIMLKKKYISYAEKKFSEGIDIVVLGHNHILELYSNSQKKIYLNNGFAQESGVFTYIEDGVPSLISIS